MNDLLNSITQKKEKLDAAYPLAPELLRNLEEWFKIELTYTSNAIEGNTLTRQETALVVEKGITVPGRSFVEHTEAVNHARALESIRELCKKKAQVKESDILDLHRMILTNIDENNTGRYRSVSVRVAGSTVIFPNPAKVPEKMTEFINWLRGKHEEHPVMIAAHAHLKLVTIHPFVDGNGRTARLLMNLLLMKKGYPPALFRKEDRLIYLNAVEKAQLTDAHDDYDRVALEAVKRSLDLYLNAVEGEDSAKSHQDVSPTAKLLKIGELAKATGEQVSTIRYWTQQGLLSRADMTPGGYQLYAPATLERVKEIRRLQEEKRLTIAEISCRESGLNQAP